MQAYVESPIYARTSGYLKNGTATLEPGSAKAKLLAEMILPKSISSSCNPRADLNTAKANARLSEITATRYAELIKTDGVSKQEVDNAAGDFEARKPSCNPRKLMCAA